MILDRIERGVPIPGMWNRWKVICEAMQPGDSVLCDSRIDSRSMMWQLRRQYGPKSYRSRTMNNGVRVWRIR